MNRRVELAESVSFSRQNAADIIQVSVSKLNNWIDRNHLWQPIGRARSHRYYTIRELFDLAGFAQMRIVGIPEQKCASFIRNFGFYQSFLASGNNDQFARFSSSDGEWQIGVYNPSAILTFSINMRVLAVKLFTGIARQLIETPNVWPDDTFENFKSLYNEAIKLDRLPTEAVPLFEAVRKSDV